MNTLDIVEILERVNINKKDAINLAEAINGKSGLATKEDLHKVESALKEDIGLLKDDVSSVKQEMGILQTSNKWIQWTLSIILALIVALLVKSFF